MVAFSCAYLLLVLHSHAIMVGKQLIKVPRESYDVVTQSDYLAGHNFVVLPPVGMATQEVAPLLSKAGVPTATTVASTVATAVLWELIAL